MARWAVRGKRRSSDAHKIERSTAGSPTPLLVVSTSGAFLESRQCWILWGEGLQKTSANSATDRPDDLCRKAMSREQLHSNIVPSSNPEATLQLQTVWREINN